jgi:hypothetical protein
VFHGETPDAAVATAWITDGVNVTFRKRQKRLLPAPARTKTMLFALARMCFSQSKEVVG